MSDKVVRSFLKDAFFKKDINPHKYAILYASKFYRVINPYLRDIENHQKRKYICQFFVNFVKYFYNYGKPQKEIVSRCSKLYRGPSFLMPSPILDKAFISTTEDKTVAERFGPKILIFKTKDLPDSVPYVTIDDSIADYLFESEILFLPGTISFDSNLKATYKPMQNILEMCEQFGGGDLNLEIPDIDLRGKMVVWYRVVQGRKPDIIDTYVLPKTHKGVEMHFRTKVLPRDSYLQDLKSFIPEYVDLQNTKNKTDKEIEKLQSYMVHMAIYDPTKRVVDTLHYGVFPEVVPEIFDITQSEQVKQAILLLL